MGWRVALLSLAACDAVFGLHETAPRGVDAPQPVDALTLLTPPDGASVCSGAPIDFTTWTWDAVAIPSSLVIYGMTLYSDAGSQRVLFTGQAQSGSSFYSVYDWDFVGTPAEIASLRAPSLTALGATPDGSALWLAEADGVQYAMRSSGWTPRLADLGLTDSVPDPGAIGFLDGTARMVVASDPNGAPAQLVEISSPDGVSWTAVAASVPAPTGSFFGFHDPSLTPDACTLVFAGVTATEVFNIYVAYRDASGAFGTPVQIVPGAIGAAYAPVLSADLANLWFMSFSSFPYQLYHGHP